MKKVLIVMSAFAVALMITLSSSAMTMSPYSCNCGFKKVECCPAAPVCCPVKEPCNFSPACPCSCSCPCKIKCLECNVELINLEKACKRTSFDVIKHSRKLSKFERIVKQAGMEDTLKCGNYIVFAPTNCALKGIKFDCDADAKKFVMNHLADAKCYPNDLCAYDSITTLCGQEFCIGQECNMMKINKSIVVANNVQTQTGRIYGLNKKLK